ncbi:GPI transamidase component [Sporothrix curviconia]|uniref:GPI transamidase component n=1 Tax=Sporothrix curviconia TaxID=1260050 RepID=A0ABP0CCN1_9PEZI
MAPRKAADAAAVTASKGALAPAEAAAPPSASQPDDAVSPTTQKQPPPEKPSEIRRRVAVMLSFWLIVGLLGLPIWWYTTTIYRANLPLDDMMEWADGKAASLQEAEANHLLRLTQHALDDLNDFSGHHLRLELPPSADVEGASAVTSKEDVALTIRLTPGDTATASLHPLQSILDVTYPPNSIPSLSSSTSTLATFVATQLRSTFAEEQAVISYLLSTSSASPAEQQRPRSLAPEVAEALARRTTRSLKYAPTYHLTFSLFTSGPAPSSWDVEAAIAEYMEPILDVLAPIHNFTIDTQVQLYAAPGVQAAVLSKQDLSSFINAAEWPLSPSIGGAPTINFIVFAGNQTINTASAVEQQQQQQQQQDEQQEPKEGESANGDNSGEPTPKDNEVVAGPGSTSQSWLIPQWGAVYLLAAGNGVDAYVSREDLREPMLTFTSHLLSLLGTPQSGSLPLRLSTLSRIRSADLLLRASSTLGSLARLSLALRNIAIPSSVAEGVESTMHHLRLACDSLGGAEGLANARIAEAEAEKAFFEKSMVGQLYFPDEHKVTVYVPLLGPVGVPLVMGLLNELRSWMRRRKERAAAEGEKKKQ